MPMERKDSAEEKKKKRKEIQDLHTESPIAC
jgi:hypothetical protein